MSVLAEHRACAMALHLAQKYLSDKNRRVLEHASGFERFTRILLAGEYAATMLRATRILESGENNVVTWADPEYPQLLRDIEYAPFVLYVRGNKNLLRDKMAAIVGTREPSAGGREAAANIAGVLAEKGSVVVSGIARGIDAIAHHAALEAGGRTIAVLPNGFNHLYPLENRDLYRIAGENPNVLFLSEYAPEIKPQKHHFVRRNRIIAGLAPLTIFVEGGIKSGGMITVNHALSYGREVAAFSHPDLTNNQGGDRLIRDGAIDLTATISARRVVPALCGNRQVFR